MIEARARQDGHGKGRGRSRSKGLNWGIAAFGWVVLLIWMGRTQSEYGL